MIPKIGPWEIAVVLVIILIVFGVGKLPQVGGAIGKGLRAFKKGQQGEDIEQEKSERSRPKKATQKKDTWTSGQMQVRQAYGHFGDILRPGSSQPRIRESRFFYRGSRDLSMYRHKRRSHAGGHASLFG